MTNYVRNLCYLTAFLATLFVSQSVAKAGNIEALHFSNASEQNFPGYTVGWNFTVNENIEVVSLGWFDGGNFGSSHAVGIWNNTGTLLYSVDVLSSDRLVPSVGAQNPLGFRYHDIAPLELTAGNYVVAGYSGTGSFFAFADGQTTPSQITWNGGFYLQSAGLVEPTTPSDRGISYFGASFEFTGASPVPEPASVITLAAGAIGMLGFRMRKRKADAGLVA